MPPFIAQVKSYAKINLSLKIVGNTPIGYHLIESYVTKLNLSDIVAITYAKDLHAKNSGTRCYIKPNYPCSTLMDYNQFIEFDDDIFYLAYSSNIVIKTAELLRHYIWAHDILHNGMEDVVIFITKNIPIAAGLGGGSSNAATTLLLLCRVWEISLTSEQIQEIATQLGADVYLFTKAETSFLMTGIGNILIEHKIYDGLHLVLLNPIKQLATAAVYALTSKLRSGLKPRLKGVDQSSVCQNSVFSANTIEVLSTPNDLQPAAIMLCSDIKVALDLLAAQNGCVTAKVTGSGSTCFAVYNTAENALKAKIVVEKSHSEWWCYHEIAGGCT